ncbi:MAG: PhzF family phenazine biosynthesis isomerase [Gammaproteobacteria bacterium]|nr:PhzF family phenazine biosynthesis isomerase [Gammaproteobacteria bacterium]
MITNSALCFCRGNSKFGNLAAVVRNFVGEDAEKQALSAQFNFPVTVFIEDENAGLPLLRFFYPRVEMSLCLHGTLAAGQYLMQLHGLNSLSIRTRSNQVLQIVQRDDKVQVALDQAKILRTKADLGEVAEMLRISVDSVDIDFPFLVANLGSPKLLVPVKSGVILNSLQPNFDLIKKWSVQHQVNGLYVYTADAPPGVDFVARGFNPKGGLNEDAATGVAAGTLISILPKSNQTDFIIDQGDAMGEACRIYVSCDQNGLVWVGGKVIFV